MKRLVRSFIALSAASILLFGPRAEVAPSLAQPRTPCDQLGARLAEVADRQAQIRADLAAADGTDDVFAAMDRFEGVLTDADALLQRMDECSRSPVPSMAD